MESPSITCGRASEPFPAASVHPAHLCETHGAAHTRPLAQSHPPGCVATAASLLEHKHHPEHREGAGGRQVYNWEEQP